MNNEILLGKLQDPKLYLEKYCKIKTKNDGLRPFILNEAQKDLFNTLRTNNRVIILKARQIGYSTAITGYFYHKTITTPGVTTALIGYNSDLTAELLDKVKTFYRTTPDALKPTIQYNSKFEISFPKLNSKILILPSTENVGRGYTLNYCLCLSGEQNVFIGEGKYKPIKELKPGEGIINGNGGKSIIKKIVKKKNNKNMLEISGYGFNDTLKLTEDHEVMVRDTENHKEIWKKAGDLTIKDFLAFPLLPCNDKVGHIKTDEFINDTYNSRTKTFDKIDVNKNLGLLIGWFLAEGSLEKGHNRIQLSIDRDELDEVMGVIEPLKKYFNKIGITYKKDSRTTMIRLNGVVFAHFVEKYFGYSSNKKISDEIWSWGHEFGKGLIYGFFRGDGYSRLDNTCVQITNTNESLLQQIKKMSVSLGLGLGSIKTRKNFRYGKECKDRSDLFFFGKANYKFRRWFGMKFPNFISGKRNWIQKNMPDIDIGHWRDGKKHYWSKIEKIEEYKHEDYVYDIVLEKDPHNFTTTCGVVHNCTELPFWEKAEEKMQSLEGSVPINGIMVIESTPGNIGDLFHKMWMSDNDYVKKEYGWWWGYSEDEINIIRKRMNNPRKFAQEFELTFSSTGRPVFDYDLIKKARKNELEVGNVRKFEDGKEFSVYEDQDKVRYYEEPKDKEIYCVGADVSEGVDLGDYSVASVYNRTTGEEVAFYRGLLAPDKFAELLNKLGRKYNNALMVVEVNNHGLTTLTVLKQLMYPTLYFRPAKFEVMGQAWSDKLGWRTTKLTRPLMIDDFAQAMRDKLLTIHSKELLDEMTVFVYDKNNNFAALNGYHDDCIFSVACCFQGFKVLFSGSLDQINYANHLPEMGGY